MATKDKLVNLEDLKAVYDHGTELLEEKADQAGSYPDLIAGTADNLLSSSYQTDKAPYILRRTPYGAREKGSIVGGSIVWNQLLDKGAYPATQTINGVTFTNNGDGTITVNGTATAQAEYALMSSLPLPYGHKVLMMGCPSGGSASTYALLDNYQSPVVRDVGNGIVYNINTTSNRATARIRVLSGVTVNNLVFKPQIFDLTLMFGSTIADYIYAQEQATAGAGVTLAKAWAGIKGYVPYDPGTIKSVTGLTAHRMTGKNLFPVDSATSTRAQNIFNNYAISLPAGTYTLSFKSNVTRAANMSVSFTMSNGESVSQNITPSMTSATFVANARITAITWYVREASNISEIQLEFGSTATQYEPYTVYSYALDSSLTLRGLPKLDGDSIYYDGDIYKADGTVERRWFLTDMGTQNWFYNANYNFFACNLSGKKAGTRNGILVGYEAAGWWSDWADKDKVWCGNANTTGFVVKDTAYTTVAEFKAHMSGVYLLTELAEPTTEQAEPYTELQACDPDGTEEWVGASMPVGHDTKYYEDLKGKLEDVPDAPSADGTYTLKVTVSGGVATYSWE